MSGLRTKLYRLNQRIKKKREQKRFGKCAVLLYHRVAKLETDPQFLSVSPQNFYDQLALLKRDYDVLTVAEFESLVGSEKRFPERAVLLTFDDGYADNYLDAMPVLEKHEVQALFYVSTSTINTLNEFWWDEVERLVLLPGAFPDTFDFTIAGKRFQSTIENLLDKKDAYSSLLPLLRNMPFAEREKSFQVLRELSTKKLPRNSHRAMTAEELKKFAASDYVVIGAHTVNHPSLAALSPEEQFSEITESKKYLESILDRQINHFSYPFGTRNDFNQTTEDVCRQLHFRYVAANYPDLVTAKTSAISFPRFIVRDWNAQRFQKELNNFFRQ